VNRTLQGTHTLTCTHRYTGRPICAIPCDGHDNLCEEYSDENCEGISVLWILAWVAVVTVILSIPMIVMEKCTTLFFPKQIKTRVHMPHSIDIISLIKERKTQNLNSYIGIRKAKYFVHAMSIILLTYKSKHDIANAKKLTLNHYKMELDCNQPKNESVDEYYFTVFGTNRLTAYIYDILDNTSSLKINSFLISKCPECILSILTYKYFTAATLFLMCIVKIVLHYSDVVKDIILLSLIYKHMLGNSARIFLEDISKFPVQVFLLILTSIVTTELCSIHTLIITTTFQGQVKYKKVLSIMIIPLIPAIVLYQE
jgi:hypothetical protein